MTVVSFSSFNYVPVLATTEVERIAYERLRDSTRDAILPLFELTRHRSAIDFEESCHLLQDFVTNQFILDLDKRVAPPPYQAQNPSNPVAEQQRVARETQENDAFNTYLSALLSPANGFQRWRELASCFPNAVPVLQYTNPAAQANAIIRQASLLSQGGNSIALRIFSSQSEVVCQIATQIIAMLPASSQIIIIFDCGQGRRGASEKAAWVQDSLQKIIAGLEIEQAAALSAVCMSNSYPQPNHEGIRIVENFDRTIWTEASESFPFIFGDYAASHKASALSSFLPRTYRATVVHSLDQAWVVHRHQNSDDPMGWAEGSAAIIASGEFSPMESWTDESIHAVAGGVLGEMSTPRPWHAARISGHIERQFAYQPEFEDDA